MTTIKKISLLVFACLLLGGVPAKGQYRVLHSFGTGGGSEPFGSLIYSGGYLFGMTSGQGVDNLGNIFTLDTNGTGYLELYHFDGTHGAFPTGSLLFSVTGDSLYGMTSLGGSNDSGVLFSVKKDGTGYNVMHNFNGTAGANPHGSLIFSITKDTLFGMTTKGGAHHGGCIFCIKTTGSGYADLLDFNGTSAPKGLYPQGGDLTLSVSGDSLFGMTYWGGANDSGVIFSVLLNGSSYTDLHDFTMHSGYLPLGSLTLSSSVLYGLAQVGGTHPNCGCIFKINTNGTGYADGHNFNAFSCQPNGSLILSPTKDTLFGLTGTTNVSKAGAIFYIQTNGADYNDIWNFNSPSGFVPVYTALILINRVLYGMTEQGGATKVGVIFRFNYIPVSTCH